MKKVKNSKWPSYDKEEILAVSEVLESGKVNYWTGDKCDAFESSFSKWSGASYSIALMNGTVALDLALRAIGIKHGDEVIVTPRSFIASVSCVVNLGAIPVFADISMESGNITPDSIESVLSSKTKAVICVHLAGWPCEMDEIMNLSSKYGFYVIEDCAQAHGAKYNGKSVGTIGHIGAWSFCQDKIMTTGGEGGMITCNDKNLWEKMRSYKDHGKNFASIHKEKTFGFRWLHDGFGTNYRMTEMQAVIGLIQLKRMEDWNSRRNYNAYKIREILLPFSSETGPIRLPFPRKEMKHAFYKLYVYLRPENINPEWTRKNIIEEINTRGVKCFSGSCPEIYKEKAFNGKKFKPKKSLKNAKILGETSIMFLVHPTLHEEEIERTQIVLKEVFQMVSKS